MENENMEVLIKNKKGKKKIIALVLFCVIIVICAPIFFSNHISKDKIKIQQSKIFVERYNGDGKISSGFTTDLYKVDGILVENGNGCVVDLDIKGDFYDKDGNWLGEHIYKWMVGPNIKFVIDPWIGLPSTWANNIAREEYTVIKCIESKGKMIDVGYSNKNDITVNVDTTNNKVTFKNNTNHEINGDFRLREICYLKDGSVLQDYIFHTTKFVPANKKISFDIYENEDYKRIKEMSEKTETFLYAFEEEKQ